MSLSIIKYPTAAVNSNKLTISKWNAVHHPIKYELQRRDFQITFFQSSPTLMQVSLSGFTGDINTILAVNDEVYIESANGSGTFPVNAIIGINSFDVVFGVFGGIGDGVGYTNLLNRKNFFILVKIWEVNPSNQYILLGTSTNKPDNTGRTSVDVSSFLKSLVSYEDDFLFDRLNQIDLMLGNRFNITFSENWFGFTGPFSGISKDDLSYFTNSSKQILDLYGSNMGEYVPFLDTAGPDPKAKFLSDFKEPTYFPGFPFSLSFIYSEFLTGIETFKVEEKFDVNGVTLSTTEVLLDNSQLPFVNRLMIDEGYVNEDHLDVSLVTIQTVLKVAYFETGYVAAGYASGGTEIPSVDDSLIDIQ